jgi:hypothetical protein
MGWQELTALAIVLVTALAFIWNFVRPRRHSFRQQTGCGCSSPGSKQSILLHARKGEPPKIFIKAG